MTLGVASAVEIDDDLTYTHTGTTETTASRCNSPTNNCQPLDEDFDEHASTEPLHHVGGGIAGNGTCEHPAGADDAGAAKDSPSLLPPPPSQCPGPRETARGALPPLLGATSHRIQWLSEGHLDTPTSPRAHVRHSSTLTRLFQKSGPPLSNLVDCRADRLTAETAWPLAQEERGRTHGEAARREVAALAPAQSSGMQCSGFVLGTVPVGPVATSAALKRQQIANLYSRGKNEGCEPESLVREEGDGQSSAAAQLANLDQMEHDMLNMLTCASEEQLPAFNIGPDAQIVMPEDSDAIPDAARPPCSFDLQLIDCDLSQMSFRDCSPCCSPALKNSSPGATAAHFDAAAEIAPPPDDGAGAASTAGPLCSPPGDAHTGSDDWDLDLLREQQEMIDRECRLKYQLQMDRQREDKLKQEQVTLLPAQAPALMRALAPRAFNQQCATLDVPGVPLFLVCVAHI